MNDLELGRLGFTVEGGSSFLRSVASSTNFAVHIRAIDNVTSPSMSAFDDVTATMRMCTKICLLFVVDRVVKSNDFKLSLSPFTDRAAPSFPNINHESWYQVCWVLLCYVLN